jgi:hypothetical protein
LSFVTPLRKEQRLVVIKNKVVRKIFGPNREDVRGAWKKLLNEEFHDWYCSPNIVWVIKCRWCTWQVWGGQKYILGFGWET